MNLPLWMSKDQAERLTAALRERGFYDPEFTTVGKDGGWQALRITAEDHAGFTFSLDVTDPKDLSTAADDLKHHRKLMGEGEKSPDDPKRPDPDLPKKPTFRDYD